MEQEYLNFGDFIARKRQEKKITLREMARLLQITAPYLSDVEKDRRNPFDLDKLFHLSSILDLSEEEKDLMMDLAGKKRHGVGIDLYSYIEHDPTISLALRTARNTKAGSQAWLDFIKRLNENQGQER